MADVVDQGQQLLVRAEAVAKAFDVPVSWVRARTRAGDLPGAISLGRYWRYDLAAIRRFIESEGRL
jgi:hypothetical protein